MNISNFFISIKSGFDYNLENQTYILNGVHSQKTNEGPVTLITFDNQEIIFEPGSFVRGHLYPLLFKKLIFDEKLCSFIGYFFQPKK